MNQIDSTTPARDRVKAEKKFNSKTREMLIRDGTLIFEEDGTVKRWNGTEFVVTTHYFHPGGP